MQTENSISSYLSLQKKNTNTKQTQSLLPKATLSSTVQLPAEHILI